MELAESGATRFDGSAAEEDEQRDEGEGCADDAGNNLALPKLGEGIDAGGLWMAGQIEDADGCAKPGDLLLGDV